MTAAELLEDIKDGLSASAWGNAITSVRRGEVALFQRSGGRYLLDVLMGRPLPFRVEIDLEGGDWSCPCRAPNGTCAHAAAAAHFLNLAEKGGRPVLTAPKRASSAPHLGHRIRTGEGRWTLETVLVDPAAPGEERPFTGTPGVELTEADRQVLGLVRAGLPGDRLGTLLNALALCEDVAVDGRPVRVTSEPIQPLLLVEDHPDGLNVRLGPRETLHQRLPGRLELIVVGDPPTLRPLGRSTLPPDQAEFYQNGRLYKRAQVVQFMSETLPWLQARTPVELRTSIASQVSVLPPYPRLKLTPAAGGFDARASIVYGRPPQAEVIGDRFTLLKGATQLPQRNPLEEQRLSAQIREWLGEPPGHTVALRGTAAARFALEVVPRFRSVSGREIADHTRIWEAPLVPRWVTDDRGQPSLVFELDRSGEAAGATASGDGGDGRGRPQRDRVGANDAGGSVSDGDSPSGRASAAEVLAAWRQGRDLIPLLDGGFAHLPQGWMAHHGELVAALLEAPGRGTSAEQAEIFRAPILAHLMEAAEVAPDLERLKAAVIQSQTAPKLPVPSTLRAVPRGYQLEGLSWLAHLETRGLGGILADDMGLGKTLQALALLLRDPPGAGPTLVVAPTSVLDNWIDEAAKFAPTLRTQRYHGGGRSLEDPGSVDLIVTSYAILRLDIDTLADLSWHRVILDEAQAIKNPDSQSAKAARRLTARHRLALTGTPVENKLLELWSLLEFLNPGLLGGRERFEDQFTRGVGEGEQGAVRRLRLRVQPFILRRMKQEVARDLPPKTEMVRKAWLSAEERRVYDAVRVAGQADVRRHLKEKGVRGSKMAILEVLLRLRQACCHAALVPGSGLSGQEPSSKVRLLIEELEEVVAEGHKALVFSQWTGLLDLVEPALKEAGIDWTRLDGSTRDRAGVVARFQADDGPGVFLISLKAGGVGLNLTAADYVYHLDPWWNPAVEDQATDRAYRIGQTRPVFAHKLIAADTVEERVLALQARKRAVADAALGGEGAWLEGLSASEIEALLA